MGQDEESRLPGPVARKISEFLLHPARAFRDVPKGSFRDSLRYYGMVLLAAAVLTAVAAAFYSGSMAANYPFGYHEPVLPYVAVIVAAILLVGTIGFGIAALLLHLLVVISGGKKGLVRTVQVLLHAATPLLLASWVLAALALFRSPAYVPVLIAVILWTIALTVIGLREFHELSTARAVMPFVLAALIITAGILAVLYLAEGDPCGAMCDRVVSVTATCSGNDILVTYQGGRDTSSLVNIRVRINGEERSPQLGGTTGTVPVGSSAVYTGPFPGRNRVAATAQYSDGVEQVVLDTDMGCGTGPPATTRPPTAAATSAALPAPVSPAPAGKETTAVQPVVTVKDGHDTLCARVRFNPAIAGCCTDTMFLINQSICCGGKLYDNETTGCCNSRPYNYTTQDCCGTTIYDQKTEYCCNSEVATLNCDGGISDINVTGLRMVQDPGGLPAITGTIVNNGTVTYTSVHMVVASYDADGKKIDAFLVGSLPGREGILKGGSMVRFGDVKGGGSLDFVVPARNPATKTMKILSLEAFYSTGSTLITFGTR